ESSCSKGDNFRLAVKVRGHPRGWRLAAGPPAIRSAAVAGVIAARQLKTRLQASIPLPQQLPLRGRLSEAQAYQAQKALEQAIHDHRTIPRNELCLHETRLIVVPYVLRIAANHGVTSGPDNASIDSQIFLTDISHGDGHDLPVLRVQHNWSS